ncbi:cysteine-rich CWC family protein [Spirosoma validum]|uniref:Cysteine-rich CWC family protein n=1 Tax=Spirosoma validum TaxID=2771355 RepID=A0A927B3F0_9BACT|nr:cysteine-rich CWC family protein [Spirosoma validum]MBD2754608.1 cysteine-rich CWC family protein [Spirosoma validum]
MDSAYKHDQVVCPRCETVYECKVGSINLCQCTSVELTEEQRQYIRSLFDGCLCARCLSALRTEYIANQSNQLLNIDHP